MIIDLHCHYTLSRREAIATPRFSFEPAECNDGRVLDSFIAPPAVRRLGFRALRWLLGIDSRMRPGDELDAGLETAFMRHLERDAHSRPSTKRTDQESALPDRRSGELFDPLRPIDRHVLLAFDRYHDDDGVAAPMPAARGQTGSDIYSSNSFIRDLCLRRPDRFLFGASVHPYRRGAVACVEEVHAAGACLLKWIPLHQNIDVHDGRTIAVLRACARLGLPLLLHYGEEFTLRTQHPEYRSVDSLLKVLGRLRRNGEMPTTIVAHVATPVAPWGTRADYERLVDALTGEFADAPLYADISALTAWGKVGFLREVAARQSLHSKLLFGSDFPIPPALPRLRHELGREFHTVSKARSWPVQMLAAFRAAGINEIVFQRAATLLPNVHAFQRNEGANSPA